MILHLHFFLPRLPRNSIAEKQSKIDITSSATHCIVWTFMGSRLNGVIEPDKRGPMWEVKITRNVVVPLSVAIVVRSFELLSSVRYSF